MKRKIFKALGMIMAFSLTVTSVSVPALAAEEPVPVEEEVLLDAQEDAEGKELTDALEEELGEQDSEELIEEEAAAEKTEEEAEDIEEESVEETDEEESSEGAGQEETDEADGEEPEEPAEEGYEAEESSDEEEIIEEEIIEEAEDLLQEGEALEVEDEDELLNLGAELACTPYARVLSGTGYDYGDLIALETQTPGAQIFYVIDNREYTLVLNETNIVWDAESSRFIAKVDSIQEYTTPIVIGVDTSATRHRLHMVAVKRNLEMSYVEDTYLEYVSKDVWGEIEPVDQYEEFDDDPSMLDDPAYQGLWIPYAQRFDESIIFTGKPITIPDLRVYYGKKLLKMGTDYTLKYSKM